jgi:hypothetical protein
VSHNQRGLSRGLAFASVAGSPALFWAVAVIIDVLRRDPEALETPLAYLAAAYFYCGPVFLFAAIILVPFQKAGARKSVAAFSFMGAVLTLACHAAAHFAYRLPLISWPISLAVGSAMGAALALTRFVTRSGARMPSSGEGLPVAGGT